MEKGIISSLSIISEIQDLFSLLFDCRLVGKVAADNSHKWVFSDSPNENDPSFSSSWNASIDPVSQKEKFLNPPLCYN